MNSNLIHLDYVINASNFQNIQDSISKATEMAILTVDFSGTPVTGHSSCTQLCRRIRENHKLADICERCDSRGGLEAARVGEPYIYLCHMGIVDFAVPIIVNGQYLGAVMAGQVLLEKESEKELLEKIINEKESVKSVFDSVELSELYKRLPVMKLDRIKSVASMIYYLINYIVEEAILKISLNELKISRNGKFEAAVEYGCQNNKNQDACSNNKKAAYAMKYNILLRPAMEYIEENYSTEITLDSMASKCNISSSYFSKLFKRDTGDNLANYINGKRIIKAKEMLRNSTDSITNISLDIGFEECGYFIKVFKRFENMTPAAYRNKYRNSAQNKQE